VLVSNKWTRSVWPRTGLLARKSVGSVSIAVWILQLGASASRTYCIACWPLRCVRPYTIPSRQSDRLQRMPFRCRSHVPLHSAPNLSNLAMCNVSAASCTTSVWVQVGHAVGEHIHLQCRNRKIHSLWFPDTGSGSEMLKTWA
jgi:hypothetical protein